MLTPIDVIITQEGKIQNSRQNGMQSSTYSASNTSYHQCYFYCACYVLGNSVTIFFFPKQINCTTHSRECLLFQNFGNSAGIQANEKQKNISTNNQRLLDEVKYDLENFADRSVCYAPHRHGFSNLYESQLKPLALYYFFFFQYVLNLKTCLPRSM